MEGMSRQNMRVCKKQTIWGCNLINEQQIGYQHNIGM